MKFTPVLLLTGYLGSGKTTLLNRILTNRRGIRFAVIVNDIGEVNIDASLIQKGGVVGGDGQDDLVALQNGCICCTLKMDLVRQLMDLVKAGTFDYIVIEASGICEPAPIAQTICAIPSMAEAGNPLALPRLDCIVTVVDALRLQSEFGAGDALTRPGIDEEDIEQLVIEQIEFCNIILLNKISEVTPYDAARIRATIRAIQPKAEIIDCDYCDVPLDRLLHTHLFDFEKVATSLPPPGSRASRDPPPKNTTMIMIIITTMTRGRPRNTVSAHSSTTAGAPSISSVSTTSWHATGPRASSVPKVWFISARTAICRSFSSKPASRKK